MTLKLLPKRPKPKKRGYSTIPRSKRSWLSKDITLFAFALLLAFLAFAVAYVGV